MNSKSHVKHYHAKPILEELETRQLFSGGVEGLLTEPVMDPNATYTNVTPPAETQQPVMQASGSETTRNEIVFVDTRVENYQLLLNDIKSSDVSNRNLEIITLDSNQDGIKQISGILAERDNLDAVHIISHGSDGSLDLGSSQLNFDTLIQNQTDISAWGNSFNQNGDILLYGCNVAETQFGQSFVEYLSGITNTEVAASEDATGSADLGGDWQLEYQTGAIETQVAISATEQTEWTGLMAVTANGTVSSAQATNVSSLTWQHTVADGSNRALFVTLAIDGAGAGVNSVTYGGVALTKVGRTVGNHAVEIWQLVNPTVGTADVVVSLGATTHIKGGAVTYNGVNQSTPTGTYASASGTGTTASVNVSSATGDLVLDITNWNTNPSGYTIGAGQTATWNLTNTNHRGVSTTEAGAATVTMSSSVWLSNQWEMGAISIKAAPVAPVVTTTGTTLSYTENAAATAVDSAITVSDADSTNLAGATISISSGFVSGQDTLNFTNQNGITGSWNSITGVLTLTGSATVANYQTALRSITYVNSSDNPSTTTRTVSFVVNDGALNSTTKTRNITVIAVNDAPVPHADSISGNEDTTITGNVLSNDTDADNNPLTATLVSGPANASSFTLNANGSFSYTPTANWSGTDSFSYLVNDGSSSILHYWALEGNAVDTVGGANGSLMNNPTTITGVSGNALQFDGSDYVALPDVTYPSNFTLSFYFKVSDNSGTGIQYLYSHGAPGSTNAVQVAIIESSYAETSRRNHLVTSFIDANDDPFGGQLFTDVSGLMGDGQWHLYTATVTAGVGTKVYVDGALRASNATGGNGINPTGTAVIGGRSDLAADRFLNANGGMDSVTLYNQALSASEVSGLLTNPPQATATITVNPVNDAPNDLYAINGVAESSLIGVYGFTNPSNLGLDSAGNSAPMTLYGNPGQTTGPSGSGALDLAGGASGQYGDIVGITTGGAMTFAASVRFDSTGDWQRVFDFGQAYSTEIGNVYVGREWNTNNLTFTIEKNGVYAYRATASNAISNGSWLHFAATVDATGNMKLYIDGNLAASTTGVALETGVRTNNFIGKSHWPDAAFDGAIDNFVIANGVMSASEVAALYQQSTGFSVAENAAIGTVVGTVVGFDVDANANPTYSLTDSAGGRFAINATNGTLTVADGSLLNYEAATSHSITAQITDSLGNTYSETLTVALTNLVDQPLQTIPLSIQEGNEDNALVFNTAGGNAISINDIFRTNLPLQVNLQVNHGALTLSQTTGLSILGGSNGSAFMTILGTEAAINAALQGLSYVPNADYQGTDSLTITTSLVASLEGHYTFENGNVLDQSVGASQNGALVGNARIVNDPARGEVLSLDGNRDYVEITGQFGNPTNVTLAAWVKSAAYNTDEVISLGDNIALRIGSAGQLTYFYYDATGLKLVNTSTYLNSDWNHVALTFDDSANTISVYLNGTLVDSRAAPNSILYARGSNTLIGAHGFGETGFDFNGLIDDARVYNRALAADEIAALAANQTTVTGSVAIQVNPVDDAPTFSSLNGNPTYVENGPAVLLDIDVTISDTELDALNGGLGNYAGASLTLLRNGGANGEDLLGFVDGNGITRSGGNLIKNGQVLATFDTTTTAGQLLVTFTAANGEIPTSADVDNILRQISYANSSDAPPASIQMNWTFSDGNTGTQGSGGALTTAGSITVSITTANDAPVFSQLNNSVNYSEGSYGVVLDADVTIFDAELSGINNFSGATLTLARHGGADSDDALAFDGTIVTVSGANVYVSGVLIGSYTFTGGEMNITFAANATQARVNSLLQNTVYWNWSDNPPVSVQIDWTFSDANSTAQGSGGALTATGITTVNITGVNDAPSGTDKTLTIEEDSTYTLTAADFGSSDTDGNNFARVWITSLPAQGELLFNGATFAVNNWVVKSDLDLGLLTFKPASNANGSSYTSFTFQVQDDGGTANGGLDRDPSSNTITFNVNAVNDAPVLSGIETTPLAYSENDPAKAVSSTLVLTDVDNTTINSATVQLSSGYIQLEDRLTFTNTANITGTWDSSTGTMTLTGVASLAEYQAALRSVAYENFSEQSTEGYLTVLIKVNNDLTSNTVARDIYITTINDAPVLNSASLTVSEGQTVTVSATNFSVSDPESLSFTYSVSNVSGGYFQLSTATGTPVTSFTSDQLAANHVQFVHDDNEAAPSFSVTVNDGALSSNTLAATINFTAVNDAPFISSASLTLNEGQTVTLSAANFGVTDPDNSSFSYTVSSVSGGYFQLSSNPGVSVTSFSTAQLAANQVQFVDDGNEVAPSLSVTVSDGALSSNTLTATINYTAVNDAPLLDNTGTMTLTLITEDQINNSGNTVADLLASAGGNRVTDVDSGAVEGIAITATTVGYGKWQYSLDGGANWLDVGTVSNTSALLLRATDSIRFLPQYENGSTPTFTFRAWDQTSGLAGNKVSTASNGGTTAFSAATETASIVVTDVNDAPVLFAMQTPVLQSVNEDAGVPVGAVGTLVSSLVDFQLPGGQVDNVGDDDIGAVLGIALVGADASNGTWYYTTNGGTNWSALGTVSDANALLLKADANSRVYFAPDSNFNGTVTTALTFRAWDQSAGTAGSTADTSNNGGTTAFSSTSDTAAITVNAVNDAPVLNTATLTLNEGETISLSAANFSVTDVDNSSFAVTVSNVTGGFFQLSTNNGVAITSFTSSQLGNGLVQFVDDGNEVAPSFDAKVGDGTLDSNTVAATILYTGINDNAPVINSGSTASIAENSATSTVVYTASGSDADGNIVTWSLSGTDAGLLNIDANSGAVTLKAAADYETKASYSFNVVASDGTLSSSQAVTLSVSNLNDNAVVGPTDSNTSLNSVAENAANGTVVGITALATDADSGATISYSLSDTAGGRFAIDSTTGVITVANGSLLDYETATNQNITVLATSSDGSSNSQSFSIAVTNLNDNPVSAISDSNTGFNSVNENAATGTVVGFTALATDADVGATVSYSLSNNAGGRFAINSTTGVVTVADGSLLDYETATSHDITVLATSSDGSTNSQTFSIAVTNVNDNPVSVVSDSNAAANSVAENAATGTVVGITALATDADAGATITYSLTDTAGGRFAIDSSTGIVTVAGGSLLDYESATSHSITVLATSSDGSTNSQSFTVNLSNLNDNPVSTITDSNATANSVAENAANGTVVGITAAASDADSGATISYSLSDDAGGRFAIDSSTGVVTVADGSLLDYESATSHSITVLTTSSDGATNSQSFTINVNNLNDNAPVLGGLTLTILEGQATTLSAANFDVNDPDTSSFTYYLSDVTGGYFQLSTAIGNPIMSFTSSQLTANLVQFVDNGDKLAPSFKVMVSDGEFVSNMLVTSINYVAANDTTSALQNIIAFNQTNGLNDKNQADNTHANSAPQHPTQTDQFEVIIDLNAYIDNLTSEASKENMAKEGDFILEPGVWVNDGSNTKLSGLLDNNNNAEQRSESNRKYHVQTTIPAVESYTIDSETELTEQEEMEFWNRLETIRKQMSAPEVLADASPVNIKVILGTSAGLTAGFVSWILRAGSLMASFMSTVPLLRRFDPLPIMRSAKKSTPAKNAESPKLDTKSSDSEPTK